MGGRPRLRTADPGIKTVETSPSVGLGPRIATGDPGVASLLTDTLSDEVKADLRENIGVLPGWMVALVRVVTG